jgi:hypothetical protein
MGTTVTLELPERTYRRAQRLAQLTQRDVTDVLADALDLSLPPFDAPIRGRPQVSQLSDEAVLALAESVMESSADKRLSLLQDRQQAEELTETERAELAQLMQVYQEGLILKAEGLAEAVRRGLRPPLEP